MNVWWCDLLFALLLREADLSCPQHTLLAWLIRAPKDSAGGVASSAAVVDQILADIFKDDGLDFIGQGVVDDVARATPPPGDGETVDDFFARFQGREELANRAVDPNRWRAIGVG